MLVTMTEYAKLHDVSKVAVSKWKRGGCLVLEGGKVDVEASDERLKGLRLGRFRTDDAPAGAIDGVQIQPGETAAQAAERIIRDGGPLLSYADALRLKENYLGRLRQLEYDQKSGAVVLIEDVAQVVGEEYAKVRTRLLALPSELAPRLARLKSPTEVQDVLQGAVVEALGELTQDGA